MIIKRRGRRGGKTIIETGREGTNRLMTLKEEQEKPFIFEVKKESKKNRRIRTIKTDED